MSQSLNVILPSDSSLYTDLITSEHQNQPNFFATVQACVQPFSDLLNVIQSFTLDFDLNTAVGSQLDTVGLWVGVNRFLSSPVNNYFSFNTANLGFNQGYWYSIGDPLTGTIVLDDDTYRLLLQARIVSNNWDGTVQGAYEAWGILLSQSSGFVVSSSNFVGVEIGGEFVQITAPPASSSGILIQDLGNMSMIFALTGNQPNAFLKALFLSGEIALYPAGVQVYLGLPTVFPATGIGGTPIFGFDADNATIAGLDIGALLDVVSSS